MRALFRVDPNPSPCRGAQTLTDYWTLGKELGRGQFGVSFATEAKCTCLYSALLQRNGAGPDTLRFLSFFPSSKYLLKIQVHLIKSVTMCAHSHRHISGAAARSLKFFPRALRTSS